MPADRGDAAQLDCLFCPDRSRPASPPGPSPTTSSCSPSTTSRPAGPDPRARHTRRSHIASAAELTEEDGPLLGRMFATLARIARDAGIADEGLPDREQHRAVGRSDRRPPPSPNPDGRPLVRDWHTRMTAPNIAFIALGTAALALGARGGRRPIGRAAPRSQGRNLGRPVQHQVSVPRSTRRVGADRQRPRPLGVVDNAVQFGAASGARTGRRESGRAPRCAASGWYQVVLPNQPDAGFVVVFSFPTGGRRGRCRKRGGRVPGHRPARVDFPRDGRARPASARPDTLDPLYVLSPSDSDRSDGRGSSPAFSGRSGFGFTVPN